MRVGDFQLGALIGRGGMGVVHEARRADDARRWAVKRPHYRMSEDPAAFERTRRELQAMARLAHPHILPVEAWGESEGGLWIAMPFVDGAHFGDALAKLTLQERLRVIDQLLDALSYAHDRGVVHRDVKPENLLIASGPHLWLSDFGIAEVAPAMHVGGSGSGEVPEVGAPVLGTPAFMAPEQIRGGSVEATADLYSVGVLLYLALAGRLPFEAANPLEVIVRQLRDPPPPLDEELPGPLRSLVERLLAKDPLERPPCASIARAELEAACVDLPIESRIAPDVANALTQALTAARPTAFAVPPTVLVSACARCGSARADDALWCDRCAAEEGTRARRPTQPVETGRARLVTVLALEVADGRQRFFVTTLRRSGAVVQRPAEDIVVAIFGPPTPVQVRRIVELAEAMASVRGGLRGAAMATGSVQIGTTALRGGPIEAAINLCRQAEAGQLLGVPESFAADPRAVPAPSGRSREIEHLEARAEEVARTGKAARIAVVGDSGMGKSVLLRQLVVRFARSWTVLTESASQGDEGAPLGVIREAVRDWAALPPAATPELCAAMLRARVPEAMAEPLAEALDPAASAGPAALPRARDLLLRLIEELARRQPVLLIIDDAQHLDAESVELLRRVSERPGRVLIVTAERSPGALPGARVELDRPGFDDACALLEAATGLRRADFPEDFDPGALSYFELTELGRRWRRSVESGHTLPPLSDRADLLGWRLEALEEQARDLLQRAAVLGPRFFGEELAATARRLSEVDETLDQLESMGLLSEVRSNLPGIKAWSFEHEMVRTRVLEEVEESLVPEVLGRSARWLEGHAGSMGAPGLGRLADHWSRADAPGRAAAWHFRAGRRAEQVGGFEGADAAYERALTCARAAESSPIDHAALLLAAARVAFEVGDLSRADGLAVQTMARAASSRMLVQADARRVRADILHALGDNDHAVEVLDEALAVLGAHGDPVLRALLLGRRGWLLGYVLGNTRPGRRDLEAALTLIAPLSEPDVEGQMYSFLGAIELREGHWDAQLECNRRALELAGVARDPMGELRAHVNLGVCYSNRGQLEDAARHTAEAAEIGARIGAGARRLVALNNLGGIRLDQGRVDEALELLDECVRACEGSGNQDIIFETLTLRGRAAVRAGRPADGLRDCVRAERAARRTGSDIARAYALRGVVLAHLALGHDEAAEYNLSVALDLSRPEAYEHACTELMAALLHREDTTAACERLRSLGADPELELRRWSL